VGGSFSQTTPTPRSALPHPTVVAARPPSPFGAFRRRSAPQRARPVLTQECPTDSLLPAPPVPSGTLRMGWFAPIRLTAVCPSHTPRSPRGLSAGAAPPSRTQLSQRGGRAPLPHTQVPQRGLTDPPEQPRWLHRTSERSRQQARPKSQTPAPHPLGRAPHRLRASRPRCGEGGEELMAGLIAQPFQHL
jgi:hypothetical protein